MSAPLAAKQTFSQQRKARLQLGESRHRRTCCRPDPVVDDPKRTPTRKWSDLGEVVRLRQQRDPGSVVAKSLQPEIEETLYLVVLNFSVGAYCHLGQGCKILEAGRGSMTSEGLEWLA